MPNRRVQAVEVVECERDLVRDGLREDLEERGAGGGGGGERMDEVLYFGRVGRRRECGVV